MAYLKFTSQTSNISGIAWLTKVTERVGREAMVRVECKSYRKADLRRALGAVGCLTFRRLSYRAESARSPARFGMFWGAYTQTAYLLSTASGLRVLAARPLSQLDYKSVIFSLSYQHTPYFRSTTYATGYNVGFIYSHPRSRRWPPGYWSPMFSTVMQPS